MNKSKNRYSNLLSNTLLFAISGFSSKILVFILSPILTSILEPGQLGIAGNLTATANLILPVMYCCFNEAIIRFGMDQENDKSSIYTSGIIIVLAGYAVLLLCYPLIKMIPILDAQYIYLIYLYVLASALRTVTTHFVRSLGRVRLFAMDGLITSVTYTVLVIVFLVVFKMGVVGYILATILADVFSALSLSIIIKGWRFFSFKRLDGDLFRHMLAYSLPLVPAAVSWWVTNASDRFLVTYYWSEDHAGLYEAAQRIPSMILMISAIFIQAWQISAFAETDTKEGEKFFSRIFKSYYSLIFFGASFLILFIRPFTNLLIRGEGYKDVWMFSPVLILSVAFSCLVTFIGTIYNQQKANTMVTVTTLIGAASNIIMNIIMIPRWGIQGAAIATCLSYMLVLIIRAIDTRKYMNLNMDVGRIVLSTFLLIIQTIICLRPFPYSMLVQVGLLLLLFFINLKQILFFVVLGIEMITGGKKKKPD